MKKLISIALVVMMVCSLASLALAVNAAPADTSINLDATKYPTVLHLSADEIKNSANDSTLALIGGSKDKMSKLTVAEDVTSVYFWGWICSSKVIEGFAYSIDGGADVSEAAFKHEAEEAVLAAAADFGATDVSRFRVTVPVAANTVTNVAIKIIYEDDEQETFWVCNIKNGTIEGESEETKAPTVYGPAVYKKYDISSMDGAVTFTESDFADTPGLKLGYGNQTALGDIDLTGYKALKITYGTDGGFTGDEDDMKTKSFWAIAPEIGTVGWATEEVKNADKIIAKVDASPADGAAWAAGERTDVIDISACTDKGPMFLYFFNSPGDEAFVTGIELIPFEEGETPENPGTGNAMAVVVVTIAVVSLASVVFTKKVRA